MHSRSIILAAAAVLPAVVLANPDFSNGGSFSIDGSFTPNQGDDDVPAVDSGAVSSFVNSVFNDATPTVTAPTMPKQTVAAGDGDILDQMNSLQNEVISGIAQPTTGLNMIPNNGSVPFEGGAAGLQIPQAFLFIARVAGFMGLM